MLLQEPLIEQALKEYFGTGYEVLAAEMELYEPIHGRGDYKFKGYIDGVIATPDGKVHIFDWKTCSWGWHARRKAEPMTTYQLTLYKHFFAQKLDVDPKDIETHFALIKRTAKKNQVEFFRVSSGKRKTENALKLLDKALYNIENKRYIKNRLSCDRCQFRHTEHCP
jgi:ATP-dependent exoDNAse (exonuclease V) beta subunit